jgi:integrase
LSDRGVVLIRSENIWQINLIAQIMIILEYSDIDISPRKFKLKIRLPKVVRKNKEALSKEDVVDILNACSDIRLKTYVMFLAAGGFRAVEALSVRVKDLDLVIRKKNLNQHEFW